MTDIGAHEEVLRLKRHIAIELMDRVKRKEIDSKTNKETVWETFKYFYNKLIEEKNE